jgi:hypothetical protein
MRRRLEVDRSTRSELEIQVRPSVQVPRQYCCINVSSPLEVTRTDSLTGQVIPRTYDYESDVLAAS